MESGGPIQATASVQIKLEVFKICRTWPMFGKMTDQKGKIQVVLGQSSDLSLVTA